jgi:hypothetical protein
MKDELVSRQSRLVGSLDPLEGVYLGSRSAKSTRGELLRCGPPAAVGSSLRSLVMKVNRCGDWEHHTRTSYTPRGLARSREPSVHSRA